MDLIGLVKDSFEAVVQEVEAACQRVPANATARSGNPAGHHDSSAEGSTPLSEVTVTEVAVTSAVAASASTVAEADSDVVPAASDEEPLDAVEASNQSAPTNDDLAGQFQILANIMQQASMQLSAAAENGSLEESSTDNTEDSPTALDDIQQEQADLRKLFESKLHSDEVQARSLERLHQELQESRKQLKRSEMAPLLKDIIFCHDFVTRELERDESGESEVDWRKSFDMLGQMLLDVLFKYDVEPFRSESDEFDRTLQQCVRSEPTTDPEKDKRIATSGLSGFRSDDRILRREQVTVYRYRPSG